MDDFEIAAYALKKDIAAITDGEAQYDGLRIEIAKERAFLEHKVEPKSVYIALKFLPATSVYGQRILPITITALSERDTMSLCQQLLYDLAIKCNLIRLEVEGTLAWQSFSTPSSTSPIEEIGNGYRATFQMGMTLVLSENANLFDVYYQGEKVETMAAGFSFDVQNDAQATFGSSDFTKSMPTLGTLTITFSGYLGGDAFTNKVIRDMAAKDIHGSYDLELRFRDGNSVSSTFRLYNFTSECDIAQLPVYAATLSE